jgi:hypothetical protein
MNTDSAPVTVDAENAYHGSLDNDLFIAASKDNKAISDLTIR